MKYRASFPNCLHFSRLSLYLQSRASLLYIIRWDSSPLTRIGIGSTHRIADPGFSGPQVPPKSFDVFEVNHGLFEVPPSKKLPVVELPPPLHVAQEITSSKVQGRVLFDHKILGISHFTLLFIVCTPVFPSDCRSGK